MTRTTYHPRKFQKDIVQAFSRSGTGQVNPAPLPVPLDSPTETAGHGVWGSPNDYIKMLVAILDGGGPILSQKSVDEMFSPQMENPQSILDVVHGVYKDFLAPSIPPAEQVDHGLSGLINSKAFPGRRAAGTLQWSGMPNLIWVRSIFFSKM